MGYLVKMPKLGMGMTEGTVLEWFVDTGEEVENGQIISEFEAEKTTSEITANEDGVLRRKYVQAGETVNPGTPLAIIAKDDEAIEDLEANVDGAPVESPGTESPTIEESAESAQQPTASTGQENTGNSIRASPKARKRARDLDVDLSTVSGTGPDGAIIVEDVQSTHSEKSAESDEITTTRQKATPKARREARERGIDLTSVSGTGPKGAVTATDLDETSDSQARSTTRSPTEQETEPGTERTVLDQTEFSGIRKTIATRLGKSYREAVHVPVHREISVDTMLEAVEAVDSYLDVNVSVTDIILLALSETLETHPDFNATYENGIHTKYRDQNIGIAVDTDRGLVTPVLRQVETRTLDDLIRERRSLTEQTLAGEYTAETLSGSTFTVTNLGVLGVDSFEPIINPPEVAILGIGKLSDQPVQTDEGVEFNSVIDFCLTIDHRVVDGADAARFLDTLAGILEEPYPIVFDRL